MYRNYRKSFALKTNVLKVESNESESKIHLAWKLVLTHLYTPDVRYHQYIQDIFL